MAAGANHFLRTETYVGIMPPWLPWHRPLVLLSGLLEIAGGLAVLPRRTRPAAGWFLVALLAAVFPANLHMALHPEAYPEIPAWALYLRLPLQGVLAWWAWWATRPGAR